MDARTREVAQWSALAGLGVPGLFSTACPTHWDLRHALAESTPSDVEQHLAVLRESYAHALALSAILAVTAGLLSESWVPVAVSALAAGAMVTSYELALPPDRRLLLGQPAAPLGLSQRAQPDMGI